MTEELCPDSYIQDILSVSGGPESFVVYISLKSGIVNVIFFQAALKASQSGKDPYISVEEASVEDVEFLLRCNLITRNPHDSTLVRLRDLV